MCKNCDEWYADKVRGAKGDLTPRGRAISYLDDAVSQLEWLPHTEDAVEEIKRIVREEV